MHYVEIINNLGKIISYYVEITHLCFAQRLTSSIKITHLVINTDNTCMKDSQSIWWSDFMWIYAWESCPLQHCSSAPTCHHLDCSSAPTCHHLDWFAKTESMGKGWIWHQLWPPNFPPPVQSTTTAKKRRIGNADKPMHAHLVCVKIITHDVDMCQDN